MERKLLVHKVHGICEVLENVELNDKDYYKIKVLNEDNLILYCPVEKKDELYRDIMTKEEALNILKLMKNIKDVEFDFSKQRRTHFKELLFSGDPKNIAYLARVLFMYKNYKLEKNQSLGLEDTRMLDAAERLLSDELSLALSLEKEETVKFIANFMEN